MAENPIDADTLRYQAQLPKLDTSGQSQFSQFVGPEVMALAAAALQNSATGGSAANHLSPVYSHVLITAIISLLNHLSKRQLIRYFKSTMVEML